MADSVLSEVDAAAIHDFLHLERDEHSQTFRGEGSEGGDLPRPDGQHSVEPVKLLVFQCCHLAHMLSGGGENRLRVCIKLFLGIGHVDHCDDSKHHALVTGGQIVQKLLGLLALELHIIRNHSREVVVFVLATLPVCDVGLDA